MIQWKVTNTVDIQRSMSGLHSDIPQPMSFTDGGVAADSIVLISAPHNQYDVKRCCCVIEKL